MLQLTCSLNEIDSVIDAIINIDESTPQIFCFRGDLGAGKTTLIKKLCQHFGYSGEVQSPTYGLVNTYPIESEGICIHHSDWYRITDLDELYETGIEDSLYEPNSIWMIEWPQVGMEILMGFHVLDIEINHQGDQREYTFTNHPIYSM